MALKFDMSRNQFTDAMYQQMAMEQQQDLGKNIGESLGLLGGAIHKKFGPAQKGYAKYRAGIEADNLKVPKGEELQKILPYDSWKMTEWDTKPKSKKEIMKGMKNLLGKKGDKNFLDTVKGVYTGKDKEKGLSGLVGDIKDMKPMERFGKAVQGGLLAKGFSIANPTQRMVGTGLGVTDWLLKSQFGDDYKKKAFEAVKAKTGDISQDIAGMPKNILQRVMDKRDERKAKRLEAKIAKTDAGLPSLQTDSNIPAYQTLEDGTLVPMSAVPSDGFDTVDDQTGAPVSYAKYSDNLSIQDSIASEQQKNAELRRKLGLPGLPQNLQAGGSILLNPNLLGQQRSATAPGFQGYGQYLYPDANQPSIQSPMIGNPGFNLGDY